jgi:hypothetical protein
MGEESVGGAGILPLYYERLAKSRETNARKARNRPPPLRQEDETAGIQLPKAITSES